jgi:hypothetical protein
MVAQGEAKGAPQSSCEFFTKNLFFDGDFWPILQKPQTPKEALADSHPNVSGFGDPASSVFTSKLQPAVTDINPARMRAPW